MERNRKVAITLLGFWGLLLVLAVPSPARGAEFSALMLVTDGAKTMSGKIYVSDGKMRQEFLDAKGQTVTIVRPDRKVVWVILPWQRSYMEMPLKAGLPGQFIQIPPQALQKRQVGQERVNGFEAEKYEVRVPVAGGLEKQTFWVATKLGLPIKMECRERQFAMEYKSIREEKVPENLFNVPPGLQKLTNIGGFADKVEP